MKAAITSPSSEYPAVTFPAPDSPVADGIALEVSAGPSQCQWSLCGSQPTDSVGLGMVGVAEEVPEAVVDSVAVAGASQCLYASVCIYIFREVWSDTNGHYAVHSQSTQ